MELHSQTYVYIQIYKLMVLGKLVQVLVPFKRRFLYTIWLPDLRSLKVGTNPVLLQRQACL